MGLPRDYGSGDTTQYLDCLEGGRQVSHRGGLDPSSGAVDALDERGTPPDLVDVSVDWDLAAGVVTSVSGGLEASDVFNGWELVFALEGACSGGGSLAEFTAANTDEDLDARALYAPSVRPEYALRVSILPMAKVQCPNCGGYVSNEKHHVPLIDVILVSIVTFGLGAFLMVPLYIVRSPFP